MRQALQPLGVFLALLLVGHERVVELLPPLLAQLLERCKGDDALLPVVALGIAILRVVPEVVHEARGLRVREGIWRRGGELFLAFGRGLFAGGGAPPPGICAGGGSFGFPAAPCPAGAFAGDGLFAGGWPFGPPLALPFASGATRAKQ
eukprot:2089487-Pyramimonas_sp.AAC.1